MMLLALLACAGDSAEPSRAPPQEIAAAPGPRVEAILLARHPELRTAGQAAFTTGCRS